MKISAVLLAVLVRFERIDASSGPNRNVHRIDSDVHVSRERRQPDDPSSEI